MNEGSFWEDVLRTHMGYRLVLLLFFVGSDFNTLSSSTSENRLLYSPPFLLMVA